MSEITSLYRLKQQTGFATGIDAFDNFLSWRGLPQGEMSLLNGRAGIGATSIWLSAVAKLHQRNKWAAWVNSDLELQLHDHEERDIDSDKLLIVSKPENNESLFAVLQELISSQIFELIGCQLREGSLKSDQLLKLKKLCRIHSVSLVILSHGLQWAVHPAFSLVIDCRRDFFVIRKASQRPTPHYISGSTIYADLMSSASESSSMVDFASVC